MDLSFWVEGTPARDAETPVLSRLVLSLEGGAMKELLRKKRFWVAVAGVAAVVVNHLLGFDETQIVDVLGALIAGIFGTSAGVSAGRE